MTRTVAAVFVMAVLGGGIALAQPREELVERTLAIVGGRAVTLADATTARALGLTPDAADLEATIEKLVERALVLREVERYAPPDPPGQAIDDAIAAIGSRLSDAQLAAVLAAGGFTEARLRNWIRDDLRIASYLEQRFAATADLSVEQAAPALRARLSAERRAGLVADWVADLRRRTPVVELWKR
jgi:hypothetical protein